MPKFLIISHCPAKSRIGTCCQKDVESDALIDASGARLARGSGIRGAMLPCVKVISNRLLGSIAVLALALIPATIACAASPAAQPESGEPLHVQFRGCDRRGACRFEFESPEPSAPSLRCVYPDGVPRVHKENVASVVIRDRLNALLAGMIHQHKRIELWHFRKIENGMFAAVVTVNGVNIATDPMLIELGVKLADTPPKSR